MIECGQLALPQFLFIMLHIIVMESKVEFNDIHDFFDFFFLPTYRSIFLTTMIRETRNRLGVALLSMPFDRLVRRRTSLLERAQ